MQLRGELLLVIVKRKAEALCDGHQSARLGREVALVCVSTADDQRQSRKRGLLLGKRITLDDGVERALAAMVARLPQATSYSPA